MKRTGGTVYWRVALAGLASLWSAPAVPATTAAQGGGSYTAEWVALYSEAADKEVWLRETQHVPFVAISPRASFTLTEPALDARGKVLLAPDTLFVAVREDPYVRCVAIIPGFKVRVACLIDRDHDGKFETLDTVRTSGSIFASGTSTGKYTVLRQPVTLTPLAKTEAPRFVISAHLYYRGKIMGRTNVSMCVVKELQKTWPAGWGGLGICLPLIFQIYDYEFPRSESVLGARITFLSRDGKNVRIKFVYPTQDLSF